MSTSSSDAKQGLDRLTAISVDDLFDATGLSRLKNTPLRWLFWLPARRFARLVHEYDQRVGQHGLASGSEWLLQKMTGGLTVRGGAHVPASGPVFILSNHPGMTDTLALFVSLAERPDLRVIAMDCPFLRALPHVARQLIFLPDDEAGRLAVVRAGVKHLRQGGALLTFPAGEIEPDPGAFGVRAATDALQHWSDSHAVFGRLVPSTRIVPTIVSHVLSLGAQANALTRLRRAGKDREKLAAALQIMWSPYQRQVQVKVSFGPPCTAAATTPGAGLLTQARQLIDTAVEPTVIPPPAALPDCAA